MGTRGQLRGVEYRLIEDLEKTTIPLKRLGGKYGVSKQAVFQFMHQKMIKRPKREHTKTCSICKELLKIAKKPHSDFISSQTIREKLGVGRRVLNNHLCILRRKGLISQKFGRLQSQKLERAYQIYFKKRLPLEVIGENVGLKNFRSVIKLHRSLGWDVPVPLFKYDTNERRKAAKRKRRR
jgi:hypothetical protein